VCRRGAAGLAIACAAVLLAPGPAAASVTIGQLPADAPTASCSSGDYLQTGVTGGNLYVAKQAGTITSWSTNVPNAGAAYVFKVFRRTSDPDVFQVVGRDAEQTLAGGVNVFPANVHVESGDLIGFHVGGMGMSSCTFPGTGDAVLQATGDLADGQVAPFSPVPDVRLNLSAVLVPSNAFTITGISRNRHRGTATLTAEVSNPGVATIAGKGLKKGRARSLAVAGPVRFAVAVVGKRLQRLSRTGKLTVSVTLTFLPTGGDPSSQTVSVKLRKRRQPLAV
jgi:hypothetical protein